MPCCAVEDLGGGFLRCAVKLMPCTAIRLVHFLFLFLVCYRVGWEIYR